MSVVEDSLAQSGTDEPQGPSRGISSDGYAPLKRLLDVGLVLLFAPIYLPMIGLLVNRRGNGTLRIASRSNVTRV